MPATLTTDSFSVSHSFPLLVLFSWKATCWLSVLGCPLESKPSIFLPSMFPRLCLFKPCFWLPFLFVIFPKWVESFPTKSKVFLATSPYSSSFWVPRGTSLLSTHCCFPSSLVFYCIAERLRRTYLSFVSCAFLVPFSSCLNPTLAVLHVPRIPGPWQSLGSRPSSFY